MHTECDRDRETERQRDGEGERERERGTVTGVSLPLELLDTGEDEDAAPSNHQGGGAAEPWGENHRSEHGTPNTEHGTQNAGILVTYDALLPLQILPLATINP